MGELKRPSGPLRNAPPVVMRIIWIPWPCRPPRREGSPRIGGLKSLAIETLLDFAPLWDANHQGAVVISAILT